ncbi:MAG TPA: hypothetical protein VIM37_02510 [Candidatus Microsaccharimonas sp.]|jgi:DNA-binding FadR family transcriptional regulator
MSSGTALDYAHEIHDKFMTTGLQVVKYVDYEPCDQPGSEGNIAEKFGYPTVYNSVIRNAVRRLEELHVIEVQETYVENENHVPGGSQGQPGLRKKECIVTLR